MKVYLVWKRYQQLQGVFSSQENAEEFVNAELGWMRSDSTYTEEALRHMFYIEDWNLDTTRVW
jgi:hypothetical protein